MKANIQLDLKSLSNQLNTIIQQLTELHPAQDNALIFVDSIYKSYINIMKTALSLWEYKLGSNNKDFKIMREVLMDKTNKIIKDVFEKYIELGLVKRCNCNFDKSCAICRGIRYLDNKNFIDFNFKND